MFRFTFDRIRNSEFLTHTNIFFHYKGYYDSSRYSTESFDIKIVVFFFGFLTSRQYFLFQLKLKWKVNESIFWQIFHFFYNLGLIAFIMVLVGNDIRHSSLFSYFLALSVFLSKSVRSLQLCELTYPPSCNHSFLFYFYCSLSLSHSVLQISEKIALSFNCRSSECADSLPSCGRSALLH